MKLNFNKTCALIGLLGLMLSSQPAKAVITTLYTPGDLLMGFNSGEQTAKNYIIDIGAASNYLNQAANTTVHVSTYQANITFGNVNTDLNSAFNSALASGNWATSGTMRWGVAATNGISGTPTGFPQQDTIFVSQDANGSAADWLADFDSTQSTWATSINGMKGAFAGKTTTAATGNKGIIQLSSQASTWMTLNPPSASLSFTHFSNTDSLGQVGIGAGNATSGITATQLDLFRLIPTDLAGSDPSSLLIGHFNIDSTGDITFTSIGAAPEPGRVMLLGLGLGGMLFRRRRPVVA